MHRKMIIGIVCIIVISLIFFGGRYIYKTIKYKEIISGIVIETPDLSSISDGTYDGSFDAIMISADVSVTVKDRQITGIVINRHKNERGESAERITNEVVSSQSLKVDTISGATNSSKVILKAIENALDKGESEKQ